MGVLRAEPKHQNILTQPQYSELLSVLREAQQAADNNHVYWDLEKSEKASQIKKAFHLIARKEGFEVTVRQVRGTRTLAFSFRTPASNGSSRMSAEESRKRIMTCLKGAAGPLKKKQVLKQTGLSSSTWNLRIRELVGKGRVHRHGERRDTTYTAA